jgi:anhydro-N-acetylmuramic acid kinase
MMRRERESRAALVLGLMSGTSADGIDVALARVSVARPQRGAELLAHTALKLPATVRKEILRVAEQQPVTAGGLSQLNFRLGEVFAEAALAACRKFRIAPGRIALIGSHGQTVFHQGAPVKYLGARTASTLQIGEPSVIAARTGITTVGDFRPADIAAGGQGAPLVPYADYLLYHHAKLGRVALNLGGIANFTVIPAGAQSSDVFAFDTGPANMVIDALVAHFSEGRQGFDKNAQLAAQGRSLPALLDELLRDRYLKLAPPKSTGREYFGRGYTERLIQLGRRHHAKPNDLIRTATILTALSIVDALHRFVLPKHKIHQMIVSGGGAKNPLILAQIAAALGGVVHVAGRSSGRSRRGKADTIGGAPSEGAIEIMPSSALGVPEEAKEAYAFALLAYETFHRRPSNIPSATGAQRPAILGKICYAPSR